MRRRVLGLAAVASWLWLAGCVIHSKPRTVQAAAPAPAPVTPSTTAAATPAPPLSIPQTQVELPPSQPVDPAALEMAPEEEAPATQSGPTARRPAAPKPPAPKPFEPANQPEAPQEAARAPVQEIAPAEELKKLQDRADARKRDVLQVLAETKSRRLTAREQVVKRNVESFLKQLDQAETRGDMRQADLLAEKAWVLAKDLGGRR